MNNLLLVQTYLESHSLEELSREYNVEYKIDTVSNKLISLNYDQIYSKKGELLSDQCRGLILAKEDYSPIIHDDKNPLGKTIVMSWPFYRFYNEGDPVAAKINYLDPETKFFHKLDGSIISVYYNQFESQWLVSTRKVPRANVVIDGFLGYTFDTLFKRALLETILRNVQGWKIASYASPNTAFDNFTDNLNKDFTYMFELTTPINKVVIEYKEFAVHLIGMRNKNTGQETWLNSNEFYGVPVCPSFNILEIGANIVEFVNSKNGSEFEGIVIRDRHFNRVKVKNIAYNYLNQAKEIAVNSPRGLLQLILLEKIDDIEPLLISSHQQKITQIKEQLGQLKIKTNEIYSQAIENSKLFPENPRKGFALKVQELNGWMGCLINMFLGKTKDITDYINQSKKNSVEWNDSFLDQLYTEMGKNK